MSDTATQGPLLIIGGNEDKEGQRAILRAFIELSGGGADARIAIMTVATRHPDAAAERYLTAFGRLGVQHIYPVHIIHPEDADSTGVHNLLEWATGVFFTGGSQYRLVSLFGGARACDLMRRRWRSEGLVIGGTSAGAAAAPQRMIVQAETHISPHRGLVEVEDGLGLIPDVLIESHFAQRGRLGRLLSALAEHPEMLGLGLDENTALLVRGDEFRVMGSGAVTVIDPRTATHSNYTTIADHQPLALCGLTFHTLPAGYGFNLTARMPLLPMSSQ
ncbi:MAG: cyanophycinase [Anaerolineae bacterium]|nr:cyanophycinase [Anaerolineae bacterium]